MKVTRILAALALVACFTGAAQAAPGCLRLSWGTCDPWVMDKPYSATTQQLIVSTFGTTSANVGTEVNIHIRPAVLDAWRFDDGGCQCPTPAVCGWKAENLSFNAKTCPVMKGANSLEVKNYARQGNGEIDLFLSMTYDALPTQPGNRNTLWILTFDHTYSVPGPPDPTGNTCGGAEQCEQFFATIARVLRSDGVAENMAGCDAPSNVPAATWQGANNCPVASQPATWGKLKGLYR